MKLKMFLQIQANLYIFILLDDIFWGRSGRFSFVQRGWSEALKKYFWWHNFVRRDHWCSPWGNKGIWGNWIKIEEEVDKGNKKQCGCPCSIWWPFICVATWFCNWLHKYNWCKTLITFRILRNEIIFLVLLIKRTFYIWKFVHTWHSFVHICIFSLV